MDHVGVGDDDDQASLARVSALRLEKVDEARLEGDWVDRVVGLEGVRSEIAMLETPDGDVRLELSKFHNPPGVGGDRDAAPNTPGIRHITFLVDDLDAAIAGLQAHGAELVGEVETYRDVRVCYVRGPEGIIVELAERSG